jgi:DNA-binding NarL/FixJ family response regulator
MTRVLLVDDHPLFLDGVRAALAGDPDIEIVGQAGSVADACALTSELAPDVVLMDLGLPDGSGIDATQAIRAASPAVRVLVMTMSSQDDAVVAAMRVGARGFVVKGAGRDELIHAVRTVASGGAVFSPAVADRLGTFFLGSASGPAFPQLSEREREVLELLARGFDNRRIARELFLSDKTVRNHVSSIVGKLGAVDRVDAIQRARRAGLGQV